MRHTWHFLEEDDKKAKAWFVFEKRKKDSYDFGISFPPEHDIIKTEQQKILNGHFKKAFTELAPRQKEIICLRYLKGMNYEELAVIMNITVRAAYKLIARSLERLGKPSGTSGR